MKDGLDVSKSKVAFLTEVIGEERESGLSPDACKGLYYILNDVSDSLYAAASYVTNVIEKGGGK